MHKNQLNCFIYIHWFRRFFALKRDLENGRDTSDTAKGLFCRRTRRSMDAEIWFENYRDTIADKMPAKRRKPFILHTWRKLRKSASISLSPEPNF